MGTIDKTIHKLTCANCDNSEEKRVLDKGSGYGGSHWQSGSDFNGFEVSWQGGDKIEPSIVKAICTTCGQTAQHESRFGGI